MPVLTAGDLHRAALTALLPTMYLRPRCHPHSGTLATYQTAYPQVLTLACKRCHALVCEIAVAETTG